MWRESLRYHTRLLCGSGKALEMREMTSVAQTQCRGHVGSKNETRVQDETRRESCARMCLRPVGEHTMALASPVHVARALSAVVVSS